VKVKVIQGMFSTSDSNDAGIDEINGILERSVFASKNENGHRKISNAVFWIRRDGYEAIIFQKAFFGSRA
jgi:hypothetical protein